MKPSRRTVVSFAGGCETGESICVPSNKRFGEFASGECSVLQSICLVSSIEAMMKSSLGHLMGGQRVD
jgi:hypothetical protein